MSFLTENFSEDMRSLTLNRKTRTKNSIGEVVIAPSTSIQFKGAIITKTYGGDRNIDSAVPLHTTEKILYTDFGITFERDDEIVDGTHTYTVKDVGVQEDFGGTDDCQRIQLDRYV